MPLKIALDLIWHGNPHLKPKPIQTYMCTKKSPGHHALGFLTLFIIDRSTGSTRADERGY